MIFNLRLVFKMIFDSRSIFMWSYFAKLTNSPFKGTVKLNFQIGCMTNMNTRAHSKMTHHVFRMWNFNEMGRNKKKTLFWL